VGKALGFVTPFDHAGTDQLDRGRVLDREEGHRRGLARVERLLALLAEQVAHLDRDVAKVDVYRARLLALVAYGAVVGHVLELGPVGERNPAPGLLFIQHGLDQQRSGQDLVARAVHQVGARHMGGAHRLAFAAAQTVLDVVRNLADLGLLHDQRLVPHQVEAGGVGVVEVAPAHQLAAVEAAVRVDSGLVVPEVRHLLVGEVVELGDADAVLARDHAVERTRQRHDAVDRAIGGLQHVVVVGVDRDVGVHVAVAGMHVQGDEHAAAQHLLVQRLDPVQYRTEHGAVEDLVQPGLDLGLPRHPDGVVLQAVEQARVGGTVGQLAGLYAIGGEAAFGFGQWKVEVLQQPLPAQAYRLDIVERGLAAVADQLVGSQIGVALVERQLAPQEFGQGVAQLKLVAGGKLDVDALDPVAVVAHPRKRNHHVLVDLERVGMARDRGGA